MGGIDDPPSPDPGLAAPTRRGFLGALAALGASGLAARAAEAESRLRRVFAEHPHGVLPIDLREQYMLADDIAYLNHASIGTVPRLVHEARAAYLEVCESNPWLYMWGGAWEATREDVRQAAARLLGTRPERIAITHNTTEGFSLLANGLDLRASDEVLFSTLNHDGASVCWTLAADRGRGRHRRFEFPVARVSELTAEDVVSIHLEALSASTRVLVVPHIDNVVGLRVPLRELADEARSRGVRWVFVDGAQSAGMIPLRLDQLGVDAYAMSPHKWIQSPKGLGLLYVTEALQSELRPMWATWGQRRWSGSVRTLEDYGTRNLPEVLALGDAIRFQEALGESDKQRALRAVWTDLRERVDVSPRLRWLSPRQWPGGASLVLIEVAGRDGSDLATELYEDHGVVVRGFATERVNGVRLSPNLCTSANEIDRFFDAVAD